MLPGILHSAKQIGETSTTMSETNAQSLRQTIESPAEDEGGYGKLCLCRHCDSPGHHVFRHAVASHHVPGVYQHRSTDISTMMQERNDTGIVEVLRPYMVTDLHPDVSGLHRSAHFGA